MNRQTTTYNLERTRAIFNGILETAFSTFLLLILIKIYNGTPFEKGLVASAGSAGLLCGPLSVYLAKRLNLTAAKGIHYLFVIGSLAYLLSTLFPFKVIFIICAFISGITVSSAIPLFTHIYQNNYSKERRGSLYSKTNTIRVAFSALFGFLAGKLLSQNLNYFPFILIIFAICQAVSAFLVNKIPSTKISEDEEHTLWHGFRYIKEDRVFKYTLICWMLMGFGNLMMIPLRVEYLANPKYGLNLSPSKIALYVAVIPSLARLFMSQFWGKLFDKVNFFRLRIVLNLCFATGIITFFTSDTSIGFLIGAIVFGISQAGGDVAWSLWVTKFAPPHLVSDYMGVHTFMTGVRGLLAPIVGFYLAERYSLISISIFSGLLILSSVVLLFVEGVKGEDLMRRKS